MAGNGQILNPDKKVVLPDLARVVRWRFVSPDAFAKFKAEHPSHVVISYINCRRIRR